jgi:hypothetical protein
MAISPELLEKMTREREEFLKDDPNANNAERGAMNAELERKQWEAEENGDKVREVEKPSAPAPKVKEPEPPKMVILDDPDLDEE